MGSILQYFDLNQVNLSRSRKRHVEGVDTPQNSSESSMEAPQSSNDIHDEIPYSREIRLSSKPKIHQNGPIADSLTDKDTSRKSTDKRNTPSVIARLMGMNNLPTEVKPTIFPNEWKHGKSRTGQRKNTSPSHLARSSASHPQEEQLQKFKKDFEQWQASRMWEQPTKFEGGNCNRRMNVDQFLAQERLNKEKLATRIVILKPGCERQVVAEENLCYSPEIVTNEGSMKDFLEEVKEKLRSEMIGNNNAKAREIISGASFGERSPDMKQFARHIAKKIRGSIGKDLGSTLVRSQSSRPYKNVLRNEKIVDAPQNVESVSPRNLSRSFSAPIPGKAFERQVLNDKHDDVKKKRKDVFNFKGTVSNLRLNIIRKGKLFGKKTHLVDEYKQSHEYEDHFSSMRPMLTVPSVGVLQDNSTEVPPSPASLADYAQDDFFGITSPVSPLPTRFLEDQAVEKLSTEISSKFHDTSATPFTKEPEEPIKHVSTAEKSLEDEQLELHSNAERYLRDILIAAGLYETKIFDESLRPIPNWVFDKIEETYTKQEEVDVDRRILFDLVNEALSTESSSSMCKIKNWVLGHNLFGVIWSRIQPSLNYSLNESSSLDDIIAEEVRMSPWCNGRNVDFDVLGRKMELGIMEDLMKDLVSEMYH